ncbi:MAG TPA: ribokinase [Bryobacteraceae bacterium]
MSRRARIIVVGSLNIDFVLAVDRLPSAGETLRGGDLALVPGGKGANQACAAGRLAGSAVMIGQVGRDPFAPLLVESLRQANVDTHSIGISDTPTGCASIYVTTAGQNSIVISAGANATLDPQTAIAKLGDLSPDDVVLLQLEIPMETVEAVADHAHGIGARVILDPAPSRALPPPLLRHIDFLTPNQLEAADLLGWRSGSLDNGIGADSAASEILSLGVQGVILKLGSSGCMLAYNGGCIHMPAFPVQSLDTTAAGDVFNGAFATALVEGRPFDDALRFSNAAAALCVTRHGAQSSVPDRTEVNEFLTNCETASDVYRQ